MLSVRPGSAQVPLDHDYLRSFMRDWRQSHQTGMLVTGADLNGDGKVNWADSQMAVGRALAGAPIISPDAVVLPTDGTVTTAPVDDTHLFLTGNPPDLDPGQILISSENGGILRKVVSATPQAGGGVLVETAPAALCEVVECGSFDATLPTDPDAQIQWEPDVIPEGVRAQSVSAGVNLGGIQLAGSVGSGSSVRFLSGRVNYQPTVNVGGSFSGFRLREFHSSVGGTLSMLARVRFENSGGALARKAEKKLCSVPLGPGYTVMIGYVPLTIRPKLEFSAGFEIGGATGFKAVEVEYSTTLNAELGARWRSGDWSAIASHGASGGIVVKYLDLGGGMWARVYVKVKAVIYLYDAVGPGIDVQVYRKGLLTVNATARTYELVDYSGVQSDFSINANILDRVILSKSWTILGPYEVEISRISGSWPTGGGGSGGTPLPQVFLSADDPRIAAGGSTILRWSSTDATSVASSNFGATKVSGSKTVKPSSTTTYTITVSGPGGTATDTAKVTVGSGGGGTIGPDGGQMVWVSAGEFMMGADDLWDSSKPIHRVRITKGFWLGKCEVTNAQYAAFLNAHGSNRDGSGQRLIYENSYNSWCKVAYVGGTWVALAGWENHPVINVTWYGAKAYCDHYGLRLPTEAEWEYAARGSAGHLYPWGDTWDASKCCNLDNLGPRWSSWDAYDPGTVPVGSLPAGDSWCGASDLAGNVWEWCNDWYDEDYYSVSPTDDPQGPLSGDYRLLRGGSWVSGDLNCRSALRGDVSPADWYELIGFRVARTS